MKRTRRAALATMLGSSIFLGVETFGVTRGRLEREVSIETVTDAEASLGLTDDAAHGSVLFEQPTGYPPATLDLQNQLAVPIDVDLTLDGAVQFDAVDTTGRVDLTDDALVASGLEPGETIEAVSLDLDLRENPLAVYGDRVTATLSVEAIGDDVAIEAERPFELTADVLLAIDLCAVRAAPDVIVAVRKRHDGRSLPTLVVERIDCASGDSSVVERLPRWSERPFELSFPSLSSTARRTLPVTSSSHVDVSVREGTDSRAPGAATVEGDGDENESDEREQDVRTFVAVDPAGGPERSADVLEVPLEE